MKIKNRTNWKTAHLRAFVSRVAQEELEPEARKTMTVYAETVHERKYRMGSTRGRARYFGNWIRLYIPSKDVNKAGLAKTIAHEFAHTRGMNHGQMRGSDRYSWDGDYVTRYAWAEALPLEEKVERKVVKLRMLPVDDKLAHAQKRLAAAATRAKRAQTFLRKWQVKVRYLQKKIAASKAEPKP